MPTNNEGVKLETQGGYDPRKQQFSNQPMGRIFRAAVIVIGLVIIAGLAYSFFRPESSARDLSLVPTVPVKKGDLTVRVTEGGALRAMKSLEIKSKIEGQRTILDVVDEGTVITPQDVEDGMVLVELDVSDLEEREGSREISFYNAESQNTAAKENYDIQVKQNESDIARAELDVKFAQMDMEHYVGAELSKLLIELGPEEALRTVDLRKLAQDEVDIMMAAEGEPVAEPAPGELRIAGAARQRLATLTSNVQLAEAELARSQSQLEWSEKLEQEQYISSNELLEDRLDSERRQVQVDSDREELRLFIAYELQKQVETLYADCTEKARALDRAKAKARSQLAQKEADRRSKELSFELETQRLEEVKEMIANAKIRAPKPGRVVYESTTNSWRRRNDPIKAGTRVWQNSTILVIPDLDTLSARVNVHETDIEKVKVGQKALISVEALPGQSLKGHVAQVSPVASAAQAWLNPDIKVYETDVALDDRPEGLTPGMSATAEIIVAELKNVLQIPVRAVTTHRGKRVCWVKGAQGPELRDIECGHFTEENVEIKDGLREGELVYVEPPLELPPEPEGQGGVRPEVVPVPEGAEEAIGVAAETAVEAEEPAQKSEWLTAEGEIDWQKLQPALMALGTMDEAAREKRWNEILAALPADKRQQLEQVAQQWQAGGGAGGAGGPGAGRRGRAPQ
jgi:HlyD family secretion protein